MEKHGLAALILEKARPIKEPDDKEDESIKDGMMAAFDEFADALKMGERESAMMSLWDFIKMCQSYSE